MCEFQEEPQAAAEASEEEAPRIDENMPAFLIAKKFGGLVAFSRALGKNPSTCHRWLVSGLIPAKHVAAVMAAAKRGRIKLKAEEFIPQPAEAG